MRAQGLYTAERTRLIELTGWTPTAPDVSRDEVLQRIREDADARAVQADSSRSKGSKAVRKGGKGGSGGVGA